jgi:hypothetical protein
MATMPNLSLLAPAGRYDSPGRAARKPIPLPSRKVNLSVSSLWSAKCLSYADASQLTWADG